MLRSIGLECKPHKAFVYPFRNKVYFQLLYRGTYQAISEHAFLQSEKWIIQWLEKYSGVFLFASCEYHQKLHSLCKQRSTSWVKESISVRVDRCNMNWKYLEICFEISKSLDCNSYKYFHTWNQDLRQRCLKISSFWTGASKFLNRFDKTNVGCTSMRLPYLQSPLNYWVQDQIYNHL